MLEHVKQFAEQMLSSECKNFGPIKQQVQQLLQECERISPSDLEASVRTDFLTLKSRLTHYATASSFAVQVMKDDVQKYLHVFDHYLGAGSGGTRRSFAYLSDPGLRPVIERDYDELAVKLYPAGAWKSAVIMAGSILEAVLFDRLAAPKWNALAVASAMAPADKHGKKYPMSEWRLENLIDVAVDIELLDSDSKATIHQVLRKYRNFVHAKREVRSAYSCGKPEATLATGALDHVLAHIEKNP
jgi:hypothetical protein